MPPDIPLDGARTHQLVTALYPFHPIVQGLAIGGVLLLIGWLAWLKFGRPREESSDTLRIAVAAMTETAQSTAALAQAVEHLAGQMGGMARDVAEMATEVRALASTPQRGRG